MKCSPLIALFVVLLMVSSIVAMGLPRCPEDTCMELLKPTPLMEECFHGFRDEFFHSPSDREHQNGRPQMAFRIPPPIFCGRHNPLEECILNRTLEILKNNVTSESLASYIEENVNENWQGMQDSISLPVDIDLFKERIGETVRSCFVGFEDPLKNLKMVKFCLMEFVCRGDFPPTEETEE